MTHTSTQQPEALRIADLLEQCSLNSLLSPFMEVANELRSQHARIEELKTKEVHTDSEQRNAIAKLLGLGDANFAWSYLHGQIKDLVKCEKELIALRKQAAAQGMEQDAARYQALVKSGNFVPSPFDNGMWGLRVGSVPSTKAELDAAVDRVIADQSQAGEQS